MAIRSNEKFKGVELKNAYINILVKLEAYPNATDVLENSYEGKNGVY